MDIQKLAYEARKAATKFSVKCYVATKLREIQTTATLSEVLNPTILRKDVKKPKMTQKEKQMRMADGK